LLSGRRRRKQLLRQFHDRDEALPHPPQPGDVTSPS